MNTADDVERATRVALSDLRSERERIEALRSLHGVEWPTASVLLHLSYAERYPILDNRALLALGVHSTRPVAVVERAARASLMSSEVAPTANRPYLRRETRGEGRRQ
jgi:hypothetical protein